MNSYCPESFVTGSGSWSSSLCRNTYFNQTSGHRPLLLLPCCLFAERGRGGKRFCLRRACISLPRAQKPQPPRFWAYPWPLGRFWSFLNDSRFLRKDQICFSVCAITAVLQHLWAASQPRHPIPIWEASLYIGYLTLSTQQSHRLEIVLGHKTLIPLGSNGNSDTGWVTRLYLAQPVVKQKPACGPLKR